MTHNKVGMGHRNSYYEAAPRRHTSEMFANYVALTSSEHGSVYKRMMHAVAPKCCAHFDNILAETANKSGANIGAY
jgi:hypothetical protein